MKKSVCHFNEFDFPLCQIKDFDTSQRRKIKNLAQATHPYDTG